MVWYSAAFVADSMICRSPAPRLGAEVSSREVTTLTGTVPEGVVAPVLSTSAATTLDHLDAIEHRAGIEHWESAVTSA
jgi:hypothetical protein